MKIRQNRYMTLTNELHNIDIEKFKCDLLESSRALRTHKTALERAKRTIRYVQQTHQSFAKHFTMMPETSCTNLQRCQSPMSQISFLLVVAHVFNNSFRNSSTASNHAMVLTQIKQYKHQSSMVIHQK